MGHRTFPLLRTFLQFVNFLLLLSIAAAAQTTPEPIVQEITGARSWKDLVAGNYLWGGRNIIDDVIKENLHRVRNDSLYMQFAIAESGKVLWCYILRSSGDEEMDRRVRSATLHSRFPPLSVSDTTKVTRLFVIKHDGWPW